jgi:hypothetical protein
MFKSAFLLRVKPLQKRVNEEHALIRGPCRTELEALYTALLIDKGITILFDNAV